MALALWPIVFALLLFWISVSAAAKRSNERLKALHQLLKSSYQKKILLLEVVPVFLAFFFLNFFVLNRMMQRWLFILLIIPISCLNHILFNLKCSLFLSLSLTHSLTHTHSLSPLGLYPSSSVCRAKSFCCSLVRKLSHGQKLLSF